MSSFVHLHVHSHYSILDGMSTIAGLVDKALKHGMPAIALTDHGNMFGIKEFYNAVKKHNGKTKDEITKLEKLLTNSATSAEQKPEIEQKLEKLRLQNPFKAIIGCEVYVARRGRLQKENRSDLGGYHLILLAKNKTGYKNLCKLVSAGWIEGFYGKPRIDHELLEKYHEGLIATSACIGGEIPQKIMGKFAKSVDDEATNDASGPFAEEAISIAGDDFVHAEEAVMWFKNLFGSDYYLELQRHKTDKQNADTEVYKKQMAVNKALVELGAKTGVKVIATNDVHFVEEEHGDAHERLICLSTGKDLDDPRRMRYTKQEWLKTPDEMNKIFGDLPDALANTLEIADKIEIFSIDSDAMMPNYSIDPAFGTVEEYRQKLSEEDLKKEFGERFEALAKKGLDNLYRIKLEADYLEKLTMEGAKKRYGENIDDELMERIRFELETMKTMGFPGYFLIVQDFINAGRQNGISFGPGRGSAAGSVVAYCLKITDLDPLQYDLLFERFLNPDRISMPDIDVDIEADGRGKVLQWVIDKYGAEKVARIITYGTMATKSSIKDVARVHKLPLQEAERLVKFVPDKFPEENGKSPKVNIKNCIEKIPELREARFSTDEILASTLKYAEMLEGTVRQTGVHACGVIIGADDLSNFVPLSTADDKETKEKVIVTQYEGGVIEDVGLIKMDFLGLETLDIIKETLKNIKKSRNIDLEINKIPLDDEKTYELFSKGQTVGIFQFESPGMQKYLRELKPSKLDDLIAMNALYRPGPMQYIPSFINRKHGRERITYDIPVMENRLKDTYGITVYQEQVMLLSRDLANFTRGQSDELRKAMGKKLVDKMATLKEKFIKGGKGNGHEESILEKIWADWAEFAKYAFNKSHSACYAFLAYQTGFLKANYPSEFMAAILTRSLNDIKEVSKLMDECKTLGIRILEPDVNESDLNFMVNKKGNLRFGLGGIKGVGEGAVAAIVGEREANGKYRNIFDFMERINLNTCNKKTLESLTYSGAFDGFDDSYREQFIIKNEVYDREGKIEKTEFGFDDELIRYGSKYQADKKTSQISLFGGFDEIEITKPKLHTSEHWSAVEKLNREREYIGMYLSAHPLDKYEFEFKYFCNTTTADLKNIAPLEGKSLKIGGIITSFSELTSKQGNRYARFTLEDYEGSHDFALFGKSYNDFGRFPAKDMYVMISAGVHPRKYYKQDRQPASPELELEITGMEELENVRKTQIDRVTVVLNINSLTSSVIDSLCALANDSEGKTKFCIEVFDEATNSSVTMLSGKYRVNVNEKFHKTVKHLIDTDEILTIKR